MAGTLEGGRRAAATNKRIYGDDYYAKIGSRGGSAPSARPKGFAADRDRARWAGARGGRISRKTKGIK